MNLRFKPVHSGLGFHPFENGLPYAPSQPKTVLKRPNPAPSRIPPPPELQKESVAEVKAETISESASQISIMIASLIDILVSMGAASLVLLTVLFSQGISFSSLSQGTSPIFVALYYLGFHFSILTAQEILTHTSLGKASLGLGLDGDALKILFRSALVKQTAKNL